MRMTLRTKGLIALCIAAFLWGTAGVTGKLLFLETPPFVAAAHRFSLASLIILPWFIRTKKPNRYVRSLLPLGILNSGNVLFYYAGLSLTTANNSSILSMTVPILTTLLSPLIIKESIRKEQIYGVTVGLIGMLIIILLPILKNGDPVHGSLEGNLLLCGSVLCWTLYILHSRRILSSGTYPAILSTSINLFSVALSSIIASILFGLPLLSPALIAPTYLLVLLYAAIGITITTFFLFQWAMAHVSAATASLKEYIQPVFGIGFNAAILNEQITASYLLGSMLVFTGVALATGTRVTKKLASVLFNRGG